MRTPLTLERLERTASRILTPAEVDFVLAETRECYCLVPGTRRGVSGRTYFGGEPTGIVEWPTWDRTDFWRQELVYAREQVEAWQPNPFWEAEVAELERRLNEVDPRVPLMFLCQLDLEELGESCATGAACFFWDAATGAVGMKASEASSSRVIVTNDQTRPELSFSKVCGSCTDREFLDSVQKIRPKHRVGLTLEPSHCIPPTAPSGVDAERFRTLSDELWSASVHRWRGYSDSVQRTVESEVQRLFPSESGWELLLQISSDDRLPWSWGDCASVYFVVPPEDFVAGRLENARHVVQSS